MYDRSVRFSDLVNNNTTSTSVELGPGSYEIGETIGKKKGEGYAPFSSLLARESFLTIKDGHFSPGPASYEAKIIYDHIKGASSIGNRSKRFNEKMKETPGPGNYEITRSLLKTAPDKIESTKRSHISRPAYAPPSIPSPGQAFGYEEGRDGVLRKQKVPDIDRTIGPAYYAVSHKETKPVQKYKGVHFGSLTSKRNTDVSKVYDTPGPGAYTLTDEGTAAKLDSLIIEETNKKPVEAKLPRYHEIISIEEGKKAVPGPGKYDLKGQFESKDTVYDATLRPSFGIQTKRFLSPMENIPAPDTYNDRRHALESCDKICGLNQSPFGQTSRRFDKPHHVKNTPAPDSYTIAGLTDQLQKKAFLSSNLKGAFNSSAKRTFPFNKGGESNMPGPTHYSLQSAPASLNMREKKSAVFKSTSSRLPDSANSVPAPGSYNITKNTRKQNVALCKMSGKPISGGFLSSTKRFSQPRDVIVRKVDNTAPGPGNYDLKTPDTPGVSIRTNIDRFKVIDNDVPGPGTYQLSPLLQHTVLKGTYNITLNNPVESALTKAVANASQISLKITA